MSYVEKKHLFETEDAGQMHWLIRKYQLTKQNKLLFYKVILKPICTYIFDRAVRYRTLLEFGNTIALPEQYATANVNAPWYVPNDMITRDLHIPSIRNDRFSVIYRVKTKCSRKICNYGVVRSLKRFTPNDTLGRFNQDYWITIINT